MYKMFIITNTRRAHICSEPIGYNLKHRKNSFLGYQAKLKTHGL